MSAHSVSTYREDHPMTPGMTLLEASAGTGKTYSVTLLYLRLLLEQELDPQQIVVTTFTRAAAAELRERIHLRLGQAEQDVAALLDQDPALDSDEQATLRGILTRAKTDDPIATIQRAREKLDASHIATIHTFAGALTDEFAMASGTPSASEFIDDVQALIRETWQDLQYTLSERYPTERAYFLKEPRLGETVIKLAGSLLSDSQLKPFPSKLLRAFQASAMNGSRYDTTGYSDAISFAEAFEQRNRQTDQLLREASTRCDELERSFNEWYEANRAALNGTKFRKDSVAKTVPMLVRSLRACAKQPDGQASLALARLTPKDFRFVTQELALESVKKGQSIQDFNDWNFWEEIRDSLPDEKLRHEHFTQQLALQVVHATRETMRARGLRSFSDMIEDVCHTLDGPNRELFVRSVRAKYKAAIIDEFQDTDENQWRIFRDLFGEGAFTYLIGDPKQAIYAFRGANVAVYEKVRAELPNERRMTLGTNYRSDEIYNDAVNQLFSARNEPESYSPPVRALIDNYLPVKSPARTPARRLRWETGYTNRACETLIGEPAVDAAITIRFKDSPPPRSAPPGALTPANWAIEHCADEIAWLLSQPTQTHAIHENGEWRAIQPSDCAVLTRSRANASAVLRALRKRQVPAVMRSTASVAASPAAEGLLAWISAIERPADFQAIRSFLTSPMVGLTLSELLELQEGELIAWSTFFAQLLSKWWSDGFVTSLHKTLHTPLLLASFQDQQRQRERGTLGASDEELSEKFPDLMSTLLLEVSGERTAADLLHLAELIHKAQDRHKMSPAALRTWLSNHRSDHGDEMSPEAFRERVESDGFNVQVITSHSSKGLEYPLVWLVGMTGGHQSDGIRSYTDPDDPTTRYVESSDAIKKALKSLSMGASPKDAADAEEHFTVPETDDEDERVKRHLNLFFPSLADAPLCERQEGEGDIFDISRVYDASANALVADDLRLLYVALTRARLRTVVYRITRLSQAAKELFDHIVDPKDPQAEPPWNRLNNPDGWAPEVLKLEEWHSVIESEDGIGPHHSPTRYLRPPWLGERPSARKAPQVHRTREGMTSFTSLSKVLPDSFAAGAFDPVYDDDFGEQALQEDALAHAVLNESSTAEFPFDDGESLVEAPARRTTALGTEASDAIDEETPFAHYSSGKDAGTALHRIFEVADFRALEEDEPNYRETLQALIARELPPLGIEVAKDGPHLLEGVIAVLRTPLGGPLGGFQLSHLARKNRLDELEFTMAMGHADQASRFQDIFRALEARRDDPAIAPEWFDTIASVGEIRETMRGMLLGFIDLVFRVEVDGVQQYFVADYKSNRIVPRDVPITSAAFTQEAMREEMAKHHYYLQYHIYLLALHRWLKTRIADYDYDRHIGGAYYLFVRGMTGVNTPMEAGATRGVFFDRPSKEIIEALDRAIFATTDSIEAGAT